MLFLVAMFRHKGLHLIKYRFQIGSRDIFSVTGKWERLLRKERLAIDDFWKDYVKQHHEDWLQKQDGKRDATKYYVLSMFPYPSGSLHMGHVRVYVFSDVIARYHRMNGKRVIHPIGWDAFGLPAENAAIERGEKPDTWTYNNIRQMREQLEALGCSFDWNRETATCHPDYYKWTQEIFLKLYHAGLVYSKEAPVNWDPVDQTVLADEQVDTHGCSWRSGAKVEKRLLRQWFIRITAYNKALYEGLNDLDPVYWDELRRIQQEWIGVCDGTQVEFSLQLDNKPLTDRLSVFTRNPECLYDAAYLLLSPQHPLNKPAYRSKPDDFGDKVYRLNIEASHPLTGHALPVFVSQTMSSEDGLDPCIGMPSCDPEAVTFVQRHGLSSNQVLDKSSDVIINSQQFSGLKRAEAFKAITEKLKEIGAGGHVTSAKSRDWLISRQRFWGTPIPIVHCKKYGAVPVRSEDLPVILPKVTDVMVKGISTLAENEEWLKVKCARCDCDGYGRRETDTMDTFVDSTWYYLRYLDPENSREAWSVQAANQNMPVDLYIGGLEHAKLHLYYSRFLHYFLYDLGLVPCREPFVRLLPMAVVMGQSYQSATSGEYLHPEQVELKGSKPVKVGTGEAVVTQWEKMSKSKYNGVDPQEVLRDYGRDTTRMCIAVMKPPHRTVNWVKDVNRKPSADFQNILKLQTRLWELIRLFRESRLSIKEAQLTEEELAMLENELDHDRACCVVDISLAIEFAWLVNALSTMQSLCKRLQKVPVDVMGQSKSFERCLSELIIMLSVFAPSFACELWTGIKDLPHFDSQCFQWSGSVLDQQWPQMNKDILQAREKLMVEYFEKERENEEKQTSSMKRNEKRAHRNIQRLEKFVEKHT